MEASRAVPPRGRRSPLRRLAPLDLERSEQPETFEQLYRRHAPNVYRYALALLANPSDAEDATQTTFLNAYRAFQRGERPRRPSNWLIAIAHNVCRMRWRQAQARPREVALDEAPEPISPERDHANLDEVLHALARLSFNQRAALVMRELEGRTYRDIADVLDLSVGAVEALLFRARRRLRLERRALGVLTTAPLPGSLTSFLGAGGGAVATGGAAGGAGLALKAVVLVAAGAVTAGVGYKSVNVVGPSRVQARASQPQANQPRGQAAATPADPARRAHKPAVGLRSRRRAARAPTPASAPSQPTGSPAAGEPASSSQPAAASQAAAPAPPPAPPPVQAVVTTVAGAAPVPVPPPPSLPLPPLPVTVTTPTIPPPPQLP